MAEIDKYNPFEAFINSIADDLGIHRPEEFIPTPSEFAGKIGVPTLEQAIPSPKDIGDQAVKRVPTPKEFFGRY